MATLNFEISGTGASVGDRILKVPNTTGATPEIGASTGPYLSPSDVVNNLVLPYVLMKKVVESSTDTTIDILKLEYNTLVEFTNKDDNYTVNCPSAVSTYVPITVVNNTAWSLTMKFTNQSKTYTVYSSRAQTFIPGPTTWYPLGVPSYATVSNVGSIVIS